MLSETQRATLLQVARDAVRLGLEHQRPLEVNAGDYDEALRQPRATFVTLNLAGRLRGCIGTLEARLPLVEDVALHAFGAAFQDPRFPPVRADELEHLDYHVSVLTPNEPMAIRHESDLLAQLVPGEDGLVIEQGGRRATFLPSVWSTLPEPRDFLAHLKYKAGIRDGDPGPLKAWRYHTESFGAEEPV